jgi:hypothetical protein
VSAPRAPLRLRAPYAEPAAAPRPERPLGDARVLLWGLAAILIIVAAVLFLSKG